MTFSGAVAGTRYVVVDHGDGLRATYGGLAGTTLGAGDTVARRRRSSDAPTASCTSGSVAATTYLDPAPLLGRLVERTRLVPTDGTAPRPAPAAAAALSGRPRHG